MDIQRSEGRVLLRGLIVAIVPVLALLLTSGTSFAASHHRHHRHHAHRRAAVCLLPGGRHSHATCSQRAVVWTKWCRHSVRCAAKHPALGARFAVGGLDGDKIAGLPEGKWVRRFVTVGVKYHISPRLLMAIGLIESYGGTTSTAYMGCLQPGTYSSWPKQILCSAHVLTQVGLSGYDPSNPSYPSIIEGHAHNIVIHAR